MHKMEPLTGCPLKINNLIKSPVVELMLNEKSVSILGTLTLCSSEENSKVKPYAEAAQTVTARVFGRHISGIAKNPDHPRETKFHASSAVGIIVV